MTGTLVTLYYSSVKSGSVPLMDGRKPIRRLEKHLFDFDEGGDMASRAFGRAYTSLRMHILSGALKAGQHIDINVLAKAFGVSTSPMREALCTLSAEGLLESTKGSGFHVPAFDFAAVTDLLKWSDHLSGQCAKAGANLRPERRRHDVTDHIFRVILLFQDIGQMAGNRETSRALRCATLRLHGLYRLESTFLPDTEAELARIEDALERTSAELPRLLHSFHRRRVAILPKIARFSS